MADRIPLGEREGQLLEFKSIAALRSPESIGREVVGMLNARKGGAVWIGLREDHGVAVELEDLENPEQSERGLFDHLLETIEPPPRDELVVDRIRDDASGHVVLRVHVRPTTGHVRYAYRKRDGRYFGVRVGDRLRMLSWSELFPGRSDSSRERYWRRAEEVVEKQLERALAHRRALLWLCLQPAGKVEIDVERFKDHFVDPSKTNNRRSGWTFVDQRENPRTRSESIVQGRIDVRCTELHRSGLIVFTTPLEYLHWKGEERLLWPFCLIEFPVSIFRLASSVYRSCRPDDDDRIATQMALLSAAGWKLKAGSVRSVQWQFTDPKEFAGEDLVTNISARLWDDLVGDNPDRCAYPLIRGVYEAFGFSEDDIPPEFDPMTGLRFPA